MIRRIIFIFLIFAFSLVTISGLVFSQDQHLERGKKLLKEEKNKEAAKEFVEIIIRYPESAEAYYYLGVAYRKIAQVSGTSEADNLNNALSVILQALKINPNDPECNYELAKIYDDMDKFGVTPTNIVGTTYDMAIEAYETAISLKNKKAYLSLGELYFRKGKNELAAKQFSHVINKIDSNNIQAYSYISNCYFNQEKYDEGVSYLKKWANLDKLNVDPHIMLGKIYRIQGKYNDALREYILCLNLDPKNKFAESEVNEIKTIIENESKISNLLKQGKSSFEKKSYSETVRFMEEILRIDPTHGEANRKLIEAKTILSDFWYSKGYEIITKDKIGKKELEDAVKYFNKALEFAITVKQVNKILLKWEEAQKTLGARAQMNVVYEKGKNAIDNRKFGIAIGYFRVAYDEYEEKREDAKYALDTLEVAKNYNLAREKEINNDLISALIFYEETKNLDSTYRDVNIRIEYIKGKIAFFNSDWSRALKHFKKVNSINSDFDDISYLIKRTERFFFLKFLFYIVTAIVFLFIISRKIIIDNLKKINILYSKYKNQIISLIFVFVVAAAAYSFFGFIITIFLIVITVITLIGFTYNQKLRNLFTIKSPINVIALLTFTTILTALVITFIAYRSENLNFEHAFLIIGTVIFLSVFFSAFSIQRLTNVNFKLLSKTINFSLLSHDNKDNMINIFGDEIIARLVEVNNFDQIKLKIKSLRIDNRIINNCKDLELSIKPVDKENECKVILKTKSEKNLFLNSFLIPHESQISLRKEKEKLVLEVKAGEKNTNSYSTNLILESSNNIILNTKKCINTIKTEVISRETESCLIDIEGISSIDLINIQQKDSLRLEFIHPQDGLEKTNVCNFKGINKLSFYEKYGGDNLKSTVEEGEIQIGKKVKNMNLSDSFVTYPNHFESLIIRCTKDFLGVHLKGKFRSLKIGEAGSENKGREEIPNLIESFSGTKLFIIIVAIIGWMSFLSAVIESKFLESIKHLFFPK